MKNKGYVFFMRHGQTDWNVKKLMQGRDEIPLNEAGIEQATWAASSLKKALDKSGIKFAKIITSPLSRAYVTGKIIAEAVGCEDLSTDQRLIERDFGELSGKPYDFNSPFITGNDDSIKGLERVEDVYLRIAEFVKENAQNNECVLAISHGSATGVFSAVTKKAPGVDDSARVLHNCHMVVFSYDGNDIFMERYDISPENLDKLEL
ncbi:MAG: histidine phosphatase family protein [Clostridia bacterium]|nr:histidine phosphatase family protein [Clostridia bacterium]